MRCCYHKASNLKVYYREDSENSAEKGAAEWLKVSKEIGLPTYDYVNCQTAAK